MPAILRVPSPGASDVDHPTILYVEDEALIATAIVEFLEGAGFAVTHVLDAAQAIAMLSAAEQPPAALVTDIRLPGGTDGWKIAREARELFPEIVVVYASGDSASDWSAMGVPDSIMLQKPFAEAQLITAVTTLLNQRRPPADTNA